MPAARPSKGSPPSAQDEIRRERDFSSAVIDTVGALVVVLDPEGRVVRFNHTCERVTGYTSPEILGKAIWEILLTPEEKTQVRAVFEHLRAGEFPNEYENDWVSKDGSHRRIAWTNTALLNEQGEVNYIIATGIDITDRRQAEQEIQSLSEFPAENPHPVLRVSMDGTLLYANKSSSILLADWKARVGKTIPQEWIELVREAMASDSPQEVEIETGDRIYSCILQPVEEGGYVNIYGRDVTEHRLAERERERLLGELETERARWQITVESMLDPVTVCDAEGHAIYMNSHYSRMIGRQIMPGLPLEEHPHYYAIYHPDGTIYDPKELPLQRAALRDEEVHGVELVQISADGTAYITVWNAAPLHNPEGRVIGAVAVGHDISEQRRAEGKLEEHLSRLSKLIEISTRILAERSLEEVYKKITEGARELTQAKVGVESLLLPSSPVTQALLRKNSIRLTQEELLSNPEWNALLEGDASLGGLLGVRLVKQDGSSLGSILVSHKLEGEFTAEDEALLLQLSAIGSLSMQHILAREDAECRADELDGVINAIADGVAIYDIQGRLTQVNPALTTLYGYDLTGENRLDVAKKLSIRLPSGQRLEEEDLPSTRALQGETLRNRRFLITDLAGREITILISAAPVYVDQRPAGAVIVVRDVTEAEKVQAALREYARRLKLANRELQDFAFIASHDLQEPLRKIRAFSERLQSHYGSSLPEEGLDYLARMSNAAARMQQMIDDLLAYSRVTTKAQPFTHVDLTQAARQAISDLEIRIEKTGGRVLLSDLPTVEADPNQMYQLFQNLIGNALKFHKPDVPPVVRVYAREPGSEGNGFSSAPVLPRSQAQIVVEDNGIGFDPKYGERIFQPFQRLHGRSEYEGTGIGLSICRKIVEQHDGSIVAESQAGEGSKFIITLPAERAVSPS